MSAIAQPRLSEEAYLALERQSETRHEFLDGIMYAMSGASHPHTLITAALAREFGIAFKRKACTISTSDLRVRVQPGRYYVYPDAVVVCGEPRFADDQKDTLLNPTLLIEVLSPSTERYDRGAKTAHYRKLESLQEYALVSQTEPSVEVYSRQPSGQWLLSEYTGLDATARFESADCAIPLAEIYDKVTFDLPAEPESLE